MLKNKCQNFWLLILATCVGCQQTASFCYSFWRLASCKFKPQVHTEGFREFKQKPLSTILLALFHAKFYCISAISNPVFRWDSCKGSEWDSVKKCSRVCKKNRDSRLDLVGDSRLQATKSCSRARHARSWSITPAGALQEKIRQLAIQLPRGWNLRLSQATRPSREPALFWKTWLFTFHSHPSINTPFTHERKRASRERNPREKLDWFIPNLH